MAALPILDNIYYVGVQDPDLRVFDIIMRTEYGTTYNAYVVRGSEKTALVETVKAEFFEEYLQNIQQVAALEDIDYIVANHTEPDHAGSYGRLLALCPNAQVLGTAAAIKNLREITNSEVRGRAVTEKDAVDLGGATLTFLSTPLLHWPDTMYTYVPEYRALFTCDSFGCHYADPRVFDDRIDRDLTEEYRFYFDAIMGPFRTPHVLNALKKIDKLDIDMIGCGHGPVLRRDMRKVMDLYRAWATPAPRGAKRVVIAYVSAYGYTRELAQAIARGLRDQGLEPEMFDLVTDDVKAAKDALSTADGFLLGSPTILGDALPPIWEMLLEINPIIHKGRLAGAFGSYGWSGEAVPNLMARLAQLRLKTPLEGLRVPFKPSVEQLAQAEEYGRAFAQALNG